MSEIDERLKEANDWMRRPDSDESFSVADLERWLNSRPVTAFEDARATIAAQAAEIRRLQAALEEIADFDTYEDISNEECMRDIARAALGGE